MIRIVAVCVALFAAGCSPAPETRTLQPPDGAGGEFAPVSNGPASAAQAGQAPTPQMLVGRWGDNGDCAKDITFSADGAFRSYTGGSGAWSLDGDAMTLSGAGGTFQVRVSVLNGDQLLIGNPDGTIGVSQRC